MLEPHMTHERNINLTPEHQRVAQGDRVVFHNGIDIPTEVHDSEPYVGSPKSFKNAWGSPMSLTESNRSV